MRDRTIKRLGFIGLGTMGAPMAGRLIAQGWEVLVSDSRPEAVAELVAMGAQAGGTPAELGSKVETVLTSLPSPEVLHSVALGKNGLIAGRTLKTMIELSTNGPKAVSMVANALKQKGVTLIDSPISGNSTTAGQGTLTLMVSADRQSFESVRPILEVLGKPVIYVGEKPGMGQYMKLVNNLLSAAALAVTCEAMVLV